MLREALEYLVTLAGKAATPTTLQPSGEPSHVYYLRNEDGTLRQVQADPQPRHHRVLDIPSLVELANVHRREFALGDDGSTPLSLWYSRTGITLLFDNATRRDRATLNLEPSPQMKTLQSLEASPTKYDQPAFLKLLRIRLAGCLDSHPNLIETIRKLKFRKTEDGQSEIVQGKASIGKSITAEMTGTQPLPELLKLHLPVWSGHPWQAEIICSLEADPQSESFTLTPLAGEIEQAYRVGEFNIEHDLTQNLADAGLDDVPVYYGTWQ